MKNSDTNRQLYFSLLKKSLTCRQYDGLDGAVWVPSSRLKRWLLRKLLPRNVLLSSPAVESERIEGRDWPLLAQTMTGCKRLDQLQACVETLISEGIPGDLIETGVWRGGSTILMRGILMSYGIEDRVVWVADSFEGLPPPDSKNFPADRGDTHFTNAELAVSVETVKANFARYDLLDNQVRFIKGWFRDTLHMAPIERLALLRLDGDMYESTMEALDALYPKVSKGGFVIVDDYGYLEACKRAVEDYRKRHQIVDPMNTIDWTGVYWRKSSVSVKERL